MTIQVRKSEERGHVDHGWFDSYHTFSFASYYDRDFLGFHSLRVINEDRLAPTKGLGSHPHAEMEIFTYMISGALEHKDSMGNKEIVKRGDIQFTSAGTGIHHSEFADNSGWAHLLQIWVKPNVSGLKPGYQTKRFEDEEKRGNLRLVVSPDGSDNSIHIHQDMKVYASILNKGERVKYTLPVGRAAYIHVVDTKGQVTINDVITLSSGDGAFISEEASVEITGAINNTEFVFFDIKA